MHRTESLIVAGFWKPYGLTMYDGSERNHKSWALMKKDA